MAELTRDELQSANGLLTRLIHPKNLNLEPTAVEFDGHRFNRELSDAGFLACLKMAYRARRGDPSAVAVLTAFRVTLYDAAHKSYWPVNSDAPAVVTPRSN